jgi:hypothetical protein
MSSSKFAPLRPQHLTDHSTLEFTLNTLTRHFPLAANGYRCQTQDLWRVLVSAAARRSTIEATCHDLLSAPGSSTVRSYLNPQLTPQQVRSLQENCNQALASQIPSWLRHKARHKALDIAIDLHDEPYYGTADLQQDNHWICRGEAQAGTTRFYRCASAYVMRNDARFTLAVEFVHPTQGLVEIVQHLLQQVRTLHIPIARLYLDKAFCSVAVLRYLQTQRSLAAIVAVPLRGKKGGTRALCQERGSYRTDYTFVSPTHGRITVPVGVVRTRAKRRGYPLGRFTPHSMAAVCLVASECSSALGSSTLPLALWYREQLSPARTSAH